MEIGRDIRPLLTKTLGEKPILLMTGARQTGKSTLLESHFADLPYVSLDDPALAAQADTEGRAFLEEHPPPCIIDEVQHAPGLFRALKEVVDRARGKRGLYVLTGSQKFELMQGASESLAGRVTLLELHSLSMAELFAWVGHVPTRAEILDWIWKGGYPELHARNLNPSRFYGDYVATYLERDVRQLLAVRNLRDFDRMLRLCATRTGQLVSLNSLASDLGLSVNTIKSWVSVLEASNVIVILEPYYRNAGKRIVKTPKLYFLDTGLAAHLAGFRSAADLAHSQLLGSFFETAALGQILRWHANRGLRSRVYFLRDHHGHEVDFVVPVGEKLKLFESKWAERPRADDTHFSYVEEWFGRKNVISKTILMPTGPAHSDEDVRIEPCAFPASLAT